MTGSFLSEPFILWKKQIGSLLSFRPRRTRIKAEFILFRYLPMRCLRRRIFHLFPLVWQKTEKSGSFTGIGRFCNFSRISSRRNILAFRGIRMLRIKLSPEKQTVFDDECLLHGGGGAVCVFVENVRFAGFDFSENLMQEGNFMYVH